MTEWLFALLAGGLAAAGVRLMLAGHLMRLVFGIALLGTAANVVVFAGGRVGETPPLVPEGLLAPEAAVANPLPQALVLTAIVIGFGLSCFALALALAAHRKLGVADPDAMRAAEPIARADLPKGA